MIEIPKGVEARLDGTTIVVKGPKGTLSKAYNPLYCTVALEGTKLEAKPVGKANRAVLAAIGSVEAHVRNMVKGVQGDYEKKLTVVYAHFPVTIEVKGDTVLIKNFLGEKLARQAKVIGATKVKVSGADITVTGPDKDAVGQTARNLVKASHINNKDIRVFQDGIYPVRS